MAHQDLALRNAVELGAWAVASAGGALLGLALAAELLRRARAGAGLVALADRLLPTAARRLAVALLTASATLTAIAVPHGARGDDHVRSWLIDDTPRPTSTTSAPQPSTSSVPVTTSTSIPTGAGREPPATAPVPTAVAPPRPQVVLRTSSGPAPASSTPPPPSTPQPPPSTVAPNAPSYTVRPGDCLWSIAAALLGRGSTARAVDRGWRAIYAANRAAVGSDPNLIHAGLVLTLPPLDPTA